MAYRFNGSGDRVEFALGPFNGHTFGAFTMAIFYKRADTSTGRVLGGFTTSADQERFFVDYVSGALRLNSDSGNLTATSSQTPNNTSLWYLSVVTWPGGSGTARFHVHDGTSWVHADAAAGSAANTAITGTDKLKVATRNPLANTTAMDVVCVGIKMADRTDGQVQTLTRTSFTDWRAFGFDWLIGFDTSLQTAGVLQDQASPGTGDEISKVGTSVVSDPSGWAWVSTVTPVANFTGTPTSGTEPLTVAFTDTSTNTPTSWAWTFGDGGTSSSQNPSHTYTTAGTYTVALTATNAAGSNTLTRTGYVTVADQPRPIRINTSQGWRDIADDTAFVSGSGVPTPAVGATGAIYLNTATGLHYGPKAAGAWPGTALPVPGGSSDPRFPSYGTTLPASPVDGQEAILVDSTSNPSYQWRLRFNSGSSSAYKWEFIGGSVWHVRNDTDDSTTAVTTWTDLTGTPGPQAQVAHAGDYMIVAGASGYNTAAGNYHQLGVGIDNIGPTFYSIQAAGPNYGEVTTSGRINGIAAGHYLKTQYLQAAAGTAHFMLRWLNVTPIRLS